MKSITLTNRKFGEGKPNPIGVKEVKDLSIPIQKWVNGKPLHNIQPFVIQRAIKSLDKLEALALIRGTFLDKDKQFASLKDAEIILSGYKYLLI